MLRLIGGVVFGYAIFAFTAVLIFQLTGRDPHAVADPFFIVGTIGAGVLAAWTGGYVGAAVASGRERTAGVSVAVIIAGAAIASLVNRPGDSAQWSQLAAFIVMAPSAYLGALTRSRRVRVR